MPPRGRRDTVLGGRATWTNRLQHNEAPLDSMRTAGLLRIKSPPLDTPYPHVVVLL